MLRCSIISNRPTKAGGGQVVRLRDVLKPGATVVTYTHYFGDDWVHEIRITNVIPGEPGVGYAGSEAT